MAITRLMRFTKIHTFININEKCFIYNYFYNIITKLFHEGFPFNKLNTNLMPLTHLISKYSQ